MSNRWITFLSVFWYSIVRWYSLSEDGSNSISSINDQRYRQGRTLINQFPFNQGAHLQSGHHGDHHQAHHGNHHGAHDDHGHHPGHGSHGHHGIQNGFPQLHQGISSIIMKNMLWFVIIVKVMK